ncbi:hypothetical protein F5Y07DRAFT_338513 [Xylaria sp. FL0933]|nr:hypothetical protein F5Y07DRAFT_338513 [Xylaria sp. FL0933]
MKLRTVLPLQCALIGSISASPFINPSVIISERKELKTCTGFLLDQGMPGLAYLHADCPGSNLGTGEAANFSAGMDLNKCMQNEHGTLQPYQDGGFASSCKHMKVEADVPPHGAIMFTADCDGGPSGGLSTTSIDLGK